MGTALEDGFAWATEAASRLDWGAALAILAVGLGVAALATAAGLAAAFYLRHGPLPTGAPGGALEAGIRRWQSARGTADRGRWICERCRSWNVPSAGACYRGCGPRDAVEMAFPGETEGTARDGGGGSPPSSEGSAQP